MLQNINLHVTALADNLYPAQLFVSKKLCSKVRLYIVGVIQSPAFSFTRLKASHNDVPVDSTSYIQCVYSLTVMLEILLRKPTCGRNN